LLFLQAKLLSNMQNSKKKYWTGNENEFFKALLIRCILNAKKEKVGQLGSVVEKRPKLTDWMVKISNKLNKQEYELCKIGSDYLYRNTVNLMWRALH